MISFAVAGNNNNGRLFSKGLKIFEKERNDYKMEVTKDTTIGDILDYNADTAEFFLEMGMHCLGCPASRGESIEAACEVHGTDADALVNKINAFLADK